MGLQALLPGAGRAVSEIVAQDAVPACCNQVPHFTAFAPACLQLSIRHDPLVLLHPFTGAILRFPCCSILLNNSLSGSLPDSWGMLGALRMLDVSGNRLEGQLPGGWAVPGALPQLATLSLGSNSLGGTLPGAWGDPRALPALSWLDASHNNISGTLPGQWGASNSFPRLRLL